MKTHPLFFSFVIAFSVLVVSSGCNEDGDDMPDMVDNVLIIDGTSYDLASGFLEELGSNGNGTFDWDLTLVSPGVTLMEDVLVGTGEALFLDLNVDDASGLAAGTYTFSAERDNFSLVQSFALEGYDFTNGAGSEIEITAGVVTVELIGNETRLEWNLTTADNRSVTGSFQGVLENV